MKHQLLDIQLLSLINLAWQSPTSLSAYTQRARIKLQVSVSRQFGTAAAGTIAATQFSQEQTIRSHSTIPSTISYTLIIALNKQLTLLVKLLVN